LKRFVIGCIGESFRDLEMGGRVKKTTSRIMSNDPMERDDGPVQEEHKKR